MPNSSQLRSSVSTWTRESSSAISRAAVVPSVGTLWSAVASGLVGAADRAARQAQAVEGLRRGDLVDQVEVDVDQPVGDLVGVPDLVEHRLRHRHQLLASGRRRPRRGARRVGSPSFSKWWARSASKVTLSPVAKLVALAVDDERQASRPGRPRSRGCPARASADRRGPPVAAPGSSGARRRRRAGRAAAGSAPRPGARPAGACGPRRGGRPRRGGPRRGAAAARASARGPAAILVATASVGLVSPRSTWESIGALTPLRSARSRSERPIASRSARIRAPTIGVSTGVASAPPRSSVTVTVMGCVRYHVHLFATH